MNWPSSRTLRALFGIDARSLALFRIGIGVLLLTDLFIRVPDLAAMYTDDGMFPRGLIRHHYTGIWHWSFHFLSGGWAVQAVLFGMAGMLALALLAGFKTRWAVIGSWLMLLSVHHRVPPILSGADTLMRMLLFWAMFLPLGRAWSLDRWLAQRRGGRVLQTDQGTAFSISSAAILLQMGLMYLFSAIFKLNSDWLEGRALAGAFAHDFYATPIGASLLAYPRLLTVLTWGALLVEWAGPVLLFFPFQTARLRMVAVVVLAALHIGIGVCLAVGLFPTVALVGLTLFLPAEFWNSRVLRRVAWLRAADSQPQGSEPQVATEPHSLSHFTERLCGLAFAYVLLVNINSHPSRPLGWLSPEKWKPLAAGAGLRQRWGMFEEIPSKDGWFVLRGKLAGGSEIDLLRNGAEVNWHRPEWPAGMYPNPSWRKLFREMAYSDELGYQVFREPVAIYLYRTWNGRNGVEKQIVRLDFIFCMEVQDPGTGMRKVFAEPIVSVPPEGGDAPTAPSR
jgi:hypothetical protein